MLALWLTPLRLECALERGRVTLLVRAGPVRASLPPRRRDPIKDAEKTGERDLDRLLRRLPPAPVLGILARQGFGAVRGLAPYVRVRQLRLAYRAGGPDPYGAALSYARAGAAMQALAARFPQAELTASADMTGGPGAVAGRVCLAVRTGNAVCAAAAFGSGFLREYFRYKKTEG